jgi:two-component system sensor histidine kinase ChvG
MRRLLNTLVTVSNETRHNSNNATVQVSFEGATFDSFAVPGHDSRLGQVIANLLSNACSFSAEAGVVRVTCRRVRTEVEIVVDDEGPGIRSDALERIFERFYTDRPHQGFGQNSGLGLSISLQIVEAHGGKIWAENRLGGTNADGDAPVLGARFVVRLPSI